MLPCRKGCAYKNHIPGSSHIRCVFAWQDANDETKAGFPVNQSNSQHTAQWFVFPFNFDPTWGPDECPAFSEQANPSMVQKPNPLADIISLLS